MSQDACSGAVVGSVLGAPLGDSPPGAAVGAGGWPPQATRVIARPPASSGIRILALFTISSISRHRTPRDRSQQNSVHVTR